MRGSFKLGLWTAFARGGLWPFADDMLSSARRAMHSRSVLHAQMQVAVVLCFTHGAQPWAWHVWDVLLPRSCSVSETVMFAFHDFTATACDYLPWLLASHQCGILWLLALTTCFTPVWNSVVTCLCYLLHTSVEFCGYLFLLLALYQCGILWLLVFTT